MSRYGSTLLAMLTAMFGDIPPLGCEYAADGTEKPKVRQQGGALPPPPSHEALQRAKAAGRNAHRKGRGR